MHLTYHFPSMLIAQVLFWLSFITRPYQPSFWVSSVDGNQCLLTLVCSYVEVHWRNFIYELIIASPAMLSMFRSSHYDPIYQPLRSGRIWHKVNFFKRSLAGLNSEFSFS